MPNFLTERALNILRGKALVGRVTSEEILAVFGHIDALYDRLDEADQDDYLGTEGWRHWVRLPDAD
jgi:hypothetical protein